MSKQIPLVCKHYILEKFNGKGGWTFVRIPEIVPSKNTPFGWVKVSGTIDDFEFSNYNLQSMGNGMIFLPIKAQIRKVINKKEGDHVFIVLYQDNSSINIPIEFELCLLDEPGIFDVFSTYSETKKKKIIEWIYAAKTEKTKVERIVKTINTISDEIIRHR
ncbi:YdeI/OmpD-associated family protein [Sphingobacterium anhuiense]|uniref:YdeI/OmpD-associated family protein n=1 Tax=Sphingobacterium anhuiense TaxID=493780 RepID=A0ABW5YXJ1_9SPHI